MKFKLIEEKWIEIHAEKYLLQKSTNEINSNGMTKTPMEMWIDGKASATMEVSFLRLEMNLVWEFSLWFRRMLSYMKQSEVNELKKWSGRSEDSLEHFDFMQDKVGIVPTLQIEMSPNIMHYSQF